MIQPFLFSEGILIFQKLEIMFWPQMGGQHFPLVISLFTG